MSIRQHRKNFRASATRLRRARRLYVYLCRRALDRRRPAERTNDVLDHMTLYMIDRGLYAPAAPKTTRYLILRQLWKQQDKYDWLTWLDLNNYDTNFYR